MPSIRERIEEFVERELSNYKPLRIRAPKVIHDTILGSNLFYPHEIAVLDLPILQRLRKINQVDVVSLVFPSGNHNRFEHTLGVTVIAEKLARALQLRIGEERRDGEGDYVNVSMDDDMIRHIRMAAILHDCGHGPFSHISQEVYKLCDDLAQERKSNSRLRSCQPHEALSYLIVTSKAFKEFFKQNIKSEYGVDINFDLVGDMIVGYVDNPNQAYLIDVINGSFDADKLDYIQRDSHFTGIKMVLDLDRLFYTVDVIRDDNGRLRLSVDLTGVSTLEQIVFNKMMLVSTVYHHHKVRAAECLFRSIFDEIRESGIEIRRGLTFESAVDFLNLSDTDIYSLSRRGELGKVASLAYDLCMRRLPMRAMVLSNRTVTKETLGKLENVMQLYERPYWSRDFREAIAETTRNLGHAVPSEAIWVDIPDTPKFKEGVNWPVKSIGAEKGYVRLRDIMPVDDWVKAFAENKWQGYIFTRPEYRKDVFDASKIVLKEIYGVEVNDYAYIYCKMGEGICKSA